MVHSEAFKASCSHFGNHTEGISYIHHVHQLYIFQSLSRFQCTACNARGSLPIRIALSDLQGSVVLVCISTINNAKVRHRVLPYNSSRVLYPRSCNVNKFDGLQAVLCFHHLMPFLLPCDSPLLFPFNLIEDSVFFLYAVWFKQFTCDSLPTFPAVNEEWQKYYNPDYIFP